MIPGFINTYLSKGYSVVSQEVNKYFLNRGFFRKLHRFRYSSKDQQVHLIPTLSDFVNPLYLTVGIYLMLLVLVWPLLDPRKITQFMGMLAIQAVITAWLVGWLYANEDKFGFLALEMLKNSAMPTGSSDSISETVGGPLHAEL
jgi:hypothetical protein